MARLTRRQNFFRAARREGQPEWMVLDFGFSPGMMKKLEEKAGTGANLLEYFKMDCRWAGPAPTERPTPDWRALYYPEGTLPAEAKIDPEWGTAHVYCESTNDEVSIPPLRSIETAAEVDAYPWPDIGAEYRYTELKKEVARLQSEDRIVVVGHGMSCFENSVNLRGFEEIMLDMAADSEVAERLGAHAHELAVRAARQAALTGADVMATGADVATQRGLLMSPAMWRKYVFPTLRDSIAAAKAVKPDILVDYHSCGNVVELMDGLIEAGIDILNPCQPEAMDIFELKRRWGKSVTFHGGIGVQSVLPFGTPEEVRAITRRTIEEMGKGGGYLCSTSHSVRPETPWENIVAMVETAREYGNPPD